MKIYMLLFRFLFLAIIVLSATLNNYAYKETDDLIIVLGHVTDKETGEPLPYVNIGVLETYFGTITNIDGYFELKIPMKHSDKKIQVSSVGYETIVLPVQEYEETLEIQLVSKNFKIKEVDIQAKSLLFLKIVKTAVSKIPENYIQTPFHYDAYYRNNVKTNDTLTKLREAAIRMYDRNGYVRDNPHKVFKQRKYKFLQVKRNFELNTLKDASTKLDELLEFDIIRLSGNVLDTNKLSLYDFSLDRITEYDNDSVWVISYSCKSPSLSTTGDYYASSYKGELYINKKDFAVVKNVAYLESTNYSPLGSRGLYVNEKRQEWTPVKITYGYSVIYKKRKNRYYLSYIKYGRNHDLVNKTSNVKKSEVIRAELMISNINTSDPEQIKKRSYYENIPYDAEFWNSFNHMKDLGEIEH